MTKLLTSSWMTVLVGVVVYLGATVAFWQVPAPSAAPADQGNPAANVNGPSWQFTNPEADQLISELKTEKEALAKKEQQLNELAARLQAEHAEVAQATQTVQGLQSEFDKLALRVHSEETANLKKLAKVYATMAPDSAAGILAHLDDDAIVKTMLFMKESEAGVILESFAKKGTAEAKRAAAISERLRVSVYRTSSPP